MEKYTIGVDFGTLSSRALLVRVSDGHEMGSAVMEYPHAVMDDVLDTGTGTVRLPPNWALENPVDYLDALATVIPAVLEQCGVNADDVIGLGVDFTTCTLLPTDADGTPLCFDERFRQNPHAYVKLWKHHAPQKYANRLNEIAAARGEEWLSSYGGAISSEWMFPKIMETLAEAPEVYDATAYFLDAGDWILWKLSGRQTRNSCMVGYKAIHPEDSYPSKEFFRELDPRLENVIEEKCNAPIVRVGSCAGTISEEGAKLCGLRPGTALATGNADAHVAAPAAKLIRPGQMLAIIGTSTCCLLLSDRHVKVPGICGVVKDGIMPGLYGYEAGLGCVGDHFAWFADRFTSAEYAAEAKKAGLSNIALLVQKMATLEPGESGLIALDWWNGNRSILADTDLSGLFVGMSLSTKPEEMFRALIEATAFGTRMIIENYREHGIPVNELTAGGGISRKNPVMMQIYADVLNMDIHIAGSAQCPALGSAIFAACAAGEAAGGYRDVFAASEAMGSVSDVAYHPNPANREVYDALYADYRELHDYFGRGGSLVMKRLLAQKTRLRHS